MHWRTGMSVIEDAAAQLKAKAARVLNHRATQFVMLVFTIFALFGEDIKMATLDKSADLSFGLLAVLCLVLFAVELVANCYTDQPG